MVFARQGGPGKTVDILWNIFFFTLMLDIITIIN